MDGPMDQWTDEQTDQRTKWLKEFVHMTKNLGNIFHTNFSNKGDFHKSLSSRNQ